MNNNHIDMTSGYIPDSKDAFYDKIINEMVFKNVEDKINVLTLLYVLVGHLSGDEYSKNELKEQIDAVKRLFKYYNIKTFDELIEQIEKNRIIRMDYLLKRMDTDGGIH